jgi:ketosteroid isomerase-like protein
MNLGRILLCSWVFLAANAAYARYERTMDGKTKVWHNAPEERIQASWSGDRDEHGYATGQGTLTWFRIQRRWETGSLLPGTKFIPIGQYTGKMVEGKLEGPVLSVDSKGNTYHAKFADGRKTGGWVAGSSSESRKAATGEEKPAKVVEAPAEGPAPSPNLERHVAEKPAATPAASKGESPTPQIGSDEHSGDSLRSLTMPPSSLRVASLTEHSTQPAASSPETTEAAAAPSPAKTETPSISVNDTDAQTVGALDTEYQAAVKMNDATTMDRILADDFVMVRGGGSSLTKADLLKQARDKQAKYEHHEVEEGTQKVRVWRDTAVVTETVWIKGAENGKPVDQKMSVTATYARTPNGWRYVSGQTSTATR